MIKAAVLDFGNTLVSTRLDWPTIVPKSLAGLEQALRPRLGEIDYPRLGADFLFLRRQARLRAVESLQEVRAVESLRAALALQGVTGLSADDLQAGIDGFFAAERSAYPIVFGIPEALAALREMGLQLAVASNATCGKLIRGALADRNLAGYFREVLVSAELGVRKPHPEIFQLAAKALDCQPEDCVMVGDDPACDIAGALKVGMRTVLVRFVAGGDDLHVGQEADATVSLPAELVKVVAAWRE